MIRDSALWTLYTWPRYVFMKRAPDDISPPDLARMAVEAYVRSGETIEPPHKLQGILAGRAGIFVTLRTLDGDLRGCIGTVEPVCETIGQEIIQNALNAALRDPRFPPVESQELNGLIYGVDVLSLPETVRDLEDLDPSQFGIIIETIESEQRGLLLPRIEGIETVEDQWFAVHRKAGIKPGTPIKVERFTVIRFGKD